MEHANSISMAESSAIWAVGHFRRWMASRARASQRSL